MLNNFLYYNFSVGDSVQVQTDVAYLSDSELTLDEIKKIFPVSDETNFSEKNITKKALKLIKENSIDVKEFKEDLITEKVVKEFLSSLSKKEPTLNINFKKNDIVIMGIGGHASMCIDILLEQNEFNLVGFIDKIETSDKKHNLNYLGSLENLDNLISMGLKNLIIGVGFAGQLKKREKYYDEFSNKINIPTIIHKKAIIENSAKMGRAESTDLYKQLPSDNISFTRSESFLRTSLITFNSSSLALGPAAFIISSFILSFSNSLFALLSCNEERVPVKHYVKVVWRCVICNPYLLPLGFRFLRCYTTL